jgi:hypothetical protein
MDGKADWGEALVGNYVEDNRLPDSERSILSWGRRFHTTAIKCAAGRLRNSARCEKEKRMRSRRSKSNAGCHRLG